MSRVTSRRVVGVLGFVLLGCTPAAPQGCTAFNAPLGSLCASTIDCADNPCTPGCSFVQPLLGCQFAVGEDQVDSCAHACINDASEGNFDTVACVHFNASFPECREPLACGGSYPASCYEVSETFGAGAVVICDFDQQCRTTPGFELPDLSSCDAAQPGDLAPPADLAPDDLETSD